VAFATVALQHPDLAVEQLEDGIKRLGLCGVSIGGSVNGEELSDPNFHPFWAKTEELGALVFLHSQGVPDLEKRLRGNGLLTNAIGNPLETTIALSHLIFEGTLDRFPGLKLCAAHGAGYLPSYGARSDRHGDGFSLSADEYGRGAHSRHAELERRRARGDPGRHRLQITAHRAVGRRRTYGNL
jgi:predicted TIM-barrel fold metal-dependent hydrolase